MGTANFQGMVDRLVRQGPLSDDRRACQGCAGPLTDAEFERWLRIEPNSGLCQGCRVERVERAYWRRAATLTETLKRAGVRELHLEATPADFDLDARLELGALWQGLTNPRAGHPGVLVHGLAGRGKTHYAAAALRVAVLCGRDSRLMSAAMLQRRVTSTYQSKVESAEAVIDGFCTVPVLVIDDLGKEPGITDHVRGVLHDVLSHRVENLRPTVITTEFGLDEIEAMYSYAIRSRLSALAQVEIGGPDRRPGILAARARL